MADIDIPKGTIAVDSGIYQELLEEITNLTGAVNELTKANSTTVIPKAWFEKDFEAYSTSGANTPRYLINNNVLYLYGALKNTKDVSAGVDGLRIMTIPANIAKPLEEVRVVQQGSSINRFFLVVQYNGEVWMSRYGATGYVTVGSGSWINLGVNVPLRA